HSLQSAQIPSLGAGEGTGLRCLQHGQATTPHRTDVYAVDHRATGQSAMVHLLRFLQIQKRKKVQQSIFREIKLQSQLQILVLKLRLLLKTLTSSPPQFLLLLSILYPVLCRNPDQGGCNCKYLNTLEILFISLHQPSSSTDPCLLHNLHPPLSPPLAVP